MRARSRADSEIIVIGNGSSGYVVEVAAMPGCGDQDGRLYRERFGCVVATCLVPSLCAPISTFRPAHVSSFANAKHLLIFSDTSPKRDPNSEADFKFYPRL